MFPLVRIGKGDRSLSVLSLSFKFQLVWLLMFCFRLHNSSKSIISGFTTFHHRDFTRYNFWKQINLQKAVKHNKRKKLISSINTMCKFLFHFSQGSWHQLEEKSCEVFKNSGTRLENFRIFSVCAPPPTQDLVGAYYLHPQDAPVIFLHSDLVCKSTCSVIEGSIT